jgi:hypothetical protein
MAQPWNPLVAGCRTEQIRSAAFVAHARTACGQPGHTAAHEGAIVGSESARALERTCLQLRTPLHAYLRVQLSELN